MQQEIDFKYANLTEDLGDEGGALIGMKYLITEGGDVKDGHHFCPLQQLIRKRKTLYVFHCYRKYGHGIHPSNFPRKLYAKMGSTLPVLSPLIFL